MRPKNLRSTTFSKRIAGSPRGWWPQERRGERTSESETALLMVPREGALQRTTGRGRACGVHGHRGSRSARRAPDPCRVLPYRRRRAGARYRAQRAREQGAC